MRNEEVDTLYHGTSAWKLALMLADGYMRGGNAGDDGEPDDAGGEPFHEVGVSLTRGYEIAYDFGKFRAKSDRKYIENRFGPTPVPAVVLSFDRARLHHECDVVVDGFNLDQQSEEEERIIGNLSLKYLTRIEIFGMASLEEMRSTLKSADSKIARKVLRGLEMFHRHAVARK